MGPTWSEPKDLDAFVRQVLGDDLGSKWLDTELPLLDGRKPKDAAGRPEEEVVRDVLRALIVGST
jgi:hypothetical protein